MLPKVCLYPRREAPVNTFYLLKIHCPKKRPFCDFFRFCTFLWSFSESSARSSDYAQNFIPFRTNPILYNNLYIFGFCAVRNRARNPRIYRNGRARGILFRFCLVFVHFRKYDTRIAICVLLEKKSLEKYCNKEKITIFALSERDKTILLIIKIFYYESNQPLFQQP